MDWPEEPPPVGGALHDWGLFAGIGFGSGDEEELLEPEEPEEPEELEPEEPEESEPPPPPPPPPPEDELEEEEEELESEGKPEESLGGMETKIWELPQRISSARMASMEFR